MELANYKKRILSAMVLACAAPGMALAQISGTGLGNLTYAPSEVGHAAGLIINREGHGWVAMHRQHLVVIYSKDSGRGNGGIGIVDVTDPRKPKTVKDLDNAETHEIREPHGWGFRGDVMCVQANYGMNFWDMSDVLNPKLLSYMKLPDIAISDYDKGLWWTCWQGGYVFGGGSGNGLYIVDAKDPAQPRFVKKLTTAQTGGFRIGPTWAIGNLLVITSNDNAGLSTLDISDPENPKLLATIGNNQSYAAGVNGNKVVMAGSGGNNGFAMIYDISNPSQLKLLGKSSPGMGDKGGYVGFSEGYAFVGFSKKGFAKIDLSKPDFPVVGSGTGGLPGHDEDFATPLGNLVFAGNDHAGQGSSLLVHQAMPDKVGPEVNMVVPADKAVNQALTSRIGVTMTDIPYGATITPENFTVRSADGQVLDGWYGHQGGMVNFSPKANLKPNMTYEVVIRAGGMTDLVGNPTTKTFRSVFSTGANISLAVLAAPPKAIRAGAGQLHSAAVLFPLDAGQGSRFFEARGRLITTDRNGQPLLRIAE